MDYIKRWLMPQDLLKEYELSLTLQNRLRSEKKIPYSKVGRQVRYDRHEIDKWFEDHRIT